MVSAKVPQTIIDKEIRVKVIASSVVLPRAQLASATPSQLVVASKASVVRVAVIVHLSQLGFLASRPQVGRVKSLHLVINRHQTR